jgi:hypothetical protein
MQTIKQVPLVSVPPRQSMELSFASAEDLLGIYCKIKQGSLSMKDKQFTTMLNCYL